MRSLASLLGVMILAGGCRQKKASVDAVHERPRPHGRVQKSAVPDKLKRQWLEKWKKNHTVAIAEECLKLYRGRTHREAHDMISDGGKQHFWIGHEAEIPMATREIEALLGGCDETSDFTRDFALGEKEGTPPDAADPRAMLRIEDMEQQGLDPDTKPVIVQVLRYSSVPLGGTGAISE